MTVALWILSGLLVVVGVVGTVLPVLPGALLVFLGLALAAWIEGFHEVGPWVLALLAALTLSTYLIDLLATALGARRVGASGWAVAGAGLGGLAGLFFGLPGILLGPFVGAASVELWRQRDWRRAGRVGLGTTLGLALGAAAKLAVVFAMLALFVAAYLL